MVPLQIAKRQTGIPSSILQLDRLVPVVGVLHFSLCGDENGIMIAFKTYQGDGVNEERPT